MLVVQACAGEQFAQAVVADAVLHQHEQAEGLVAVLVVGDPQVGAEDGLDPGLARGAVEAHRPEHVGQVREREGALAVGGGGLHRIVQAHDAVGDRELGVQPEVDEGRNGSLGHRGILASGLRAPRARRARRDALERHC